VPYGSGSNDGDKLLVDKPRVEECVFVSSRGSDVSSTRTRRGAAGNIGTAPAFAMAPAKDVATTMAPAKRFALRFAMRFAVRGRVGFVRLSIQSVFCGGMHACPPRRDMKLRAALAWGKQMPFFGRVHVGATKNESRHKHALSFMAFKHWRYWRRNRCGIARAATKKNN
jgi:hypothetical protein